MMRFRALSSPALRLARALTVPFFLGTLALGSGCEKPNEPAAVAPEDLSPVKAPEGLLADLLVPAPDATWAKTRAIVGGPAAFMPQSFGGLAATLLSLPITAGAEIDDKMPVLGAVLRKPNEPGSGVLGLHVKAGDRFVDQLTKGPEARYVATLDGGSRVRVLALKEAPAASRTMVMGVLGNYLLIAPTLGDLYAAGPYVARTLPTRALTKEDAILDFPEESLSGPIAEAMKKQWMAAREGLEGARAPLLPFTSTVDSVIAVLTDARHARLTVDLGTETVKTRFSLEPKSATGIAAKTLSELAVGDARAVLDLPANALLAMTWRDSATTRASAIAAQTDAVQKLLGGDGPASDKEAIAAAFQAESAARGDWVALGVALDPTGPSAIVRAPIKSEGEMGKALEQLLDLAKLPAAKARLAEAQLSIETGKTVVDNLPGDVRRVRFVRLDKADPKGDPLLDDKAEKPGAAAKKGDKGPKAERSIGSPTAAPVPSTIDLLYLLGKDTLFGAVGPDPRAALRGLVTLTPEQSLAQSAAVKSAVDALGTESSFVLVLDPIRLVAARAGKPAPEAASPLIFSIGKTGSPPVLMGKLDVATSAIQELVKHRGAF